MIKAYQYKRSIPREIFNCLTEKRDMIWVQITEIYVPTVNIVFDSDGNIKRDSSYYNFDLNNMTVESVTFKTNFKIIEINKDIAEKLKEILKIHDELYERSTKLIKELF